MYIQYGYSITCQVFSLLLSTNFTNADTIHGIITKDGNGLSGKRVVARQEIIAGYKVGSKPCRSSHPNIQTIATTETDANGSYAISYTTAQQPPGSCSFSAKVYVQVFDGDKLLWTSPKVLARRQVTLSHDFSDPPPATAPHDDLITSEEATVIVDNKDSLLTGLRNAKPGDIIYITADDIDLSGEANIEIKQGVTLASSRGNGINEGVLIQSREMTPILFVVTGSNVRVTGIRFKGPSTKAGADPSSGCISVPGDHRNIEIDHCEFFGWPQYGVHLDYSELPKQELSSVHIHDNYIHHNLGFNKDTGAGYGIVVYDAYALIEKNVFDQNRHAIAGGGDSTSGYEARWNVVLDKNAASEQSFDMHRFGPKDAWGPAGEYVKVHQNTFLYEDDPAFIIRGKPIEVAIVENNSFIHGRSITPFLKHYRHAVSQKNEDGNLIVRNNRYGVNHQHELAFGDFDGDGGTDVFWADGRNWWVSRRGELVWMYLDSSSITLRDLAFADFDGDGKTDVFRSNSSRQEWLVSWGGTSGWKKINSSPVDMKDLAFGDFNGDGKTDIFRTLSGRQEWLVSWGGKSRWRKLNSSAVDLKDMAFGDFDGDGKTDIFRTHTGRREWLVSWGGTSGWRKLNSSDIGLHDLAFGDFDGDGKTDVFHIAGDRNQWWFFYGGTQKQVRLNKPNIALKDLALGDFNADGKTDVFRRVGTEWYVSWSGRTDWVQINSSFDGDI